MKRILVFSAAVVFILSVFVSCDSSSDESQGGGSAPSTDRSVPLTLEFLSDGKLSFSTPPSSLRYSTDGGETKLAYTGEIDVSEGTSICIFADRSSWEDLRINCTSDCYVYGNVMSLIDMDDYASETEVFERAFSNLFNGNIYIKNHPTKKLVLPATELEDYCYSYMFCGCTGLTAAPELPATELEDYCYQGMFRDCTKLSSAPALPAETLEDYCYIYMFNGCTELSSISCSATNITTATSPTLNWVTDVADSGTFRKPSTMNDWTSGDSGIPSGWSTSNL